MDYNTSYIINWIKEMANYHGGIVVSKEQDLYDWGQALMRERHGKNWNAHSDDIPDEKCLKIADDWREGKEPEWVDYYL